jgi:hypothetical protein
MRDFVISALVLIASFTAIFATVAMAAPSANDNESGVAIVRKLSDDEAAAFLRRDAGALSGMWSDELVVTNPLNNVVTKQQVLEMVRSGFLIITSYSRKVEYEKKYGDIVILVGAEEVVWGGRMPNAGKSEKLRFTAVWRNENGTWREVARHANIIHTASQ